MAKATDERIFISGARRVAEVALGLKKDLTAPGRDVWLDAERIAGGATRTVRIQQAIDRTQVVPAILTPGSYSSEIYRAEQLRLVLRIYGIRHRGRSVYLCPLPERHP